MGGPVLSRRLALSGALAFAATAPSQVAAQRAPWREIKVNAQPIARFLRGSDANSFGRLSFRGGLVLTSPDRDFGGLSGLAIEPNGRSFVAITDEGGWLTADLALDGIRPIGLEHARFGPILDQAGRPLVRKRDNDCEAVAILDGDLQRGTLLMAFERNHRIEHFPILERVVQAPTGSLPMPREAARMDANAGLEAMTVMAGGPYKGAVIAFSERLLDADGNHTGWLWLDGAPRRLGLSAVGGFDLTDAASLPDGSLLVLERRFRFMEGVKLQMRLVPAAEIAPGRLAQGQVLLTSGRGYEIDNMEGLSAHQEADGTTVLTLISDNNFNFLQRTILLRFALSV